MSYYYSRIKKKINIILGSFITLFYQSFNLRKRYKKIRSVDAFICEHFSLNKEGKISIDLGCGIQPKNPFQVNQVFGIDIRQDLEKGILKADLSKESIPFKSTFADFCTAFDFIEHIPRSIQLNGETRLSFIEIMNEIYRVLKPGGIFLHLTPAYPSKEAFQDPTHVNIITEDTFPYYFCSPYLWASAYGFNGNFELLNQVWLGSSHVLSIMKAKK
tara:strand:+ start:841 stop:1488 length:648 start_codon:yes stop_codon:yes gene_type:complete